MRIFTAVLAVELLKVFFSSNTVTGVVLVPLVIALAADLGLEPWLLAGQVAIATSMAFLLVTSSPTNVPYTAGYFTIKDFARAGATPLGRVGTPEDVAAAVAFFASPDADYLTGEMLNITGGNGFRPIL